MSDSVKRHFDIMASHFFIGVYKSSYHLPGAAGKRVRASIKASFEEVLFGDCASMLATIAREDTISMDRAGDLVMLKQVRNALSGNLLFHAGQAANRRLKVWRQARKLRKYAAALALTENS